MVVGVLQSSRHYTQQNNRRHALRESDDVVIAAACPGQPASRLSFADAPAVTMGAAAAKWSLTSTPLAQPLRPGLLQLLSSICEGIPVRIPVRLILREGPKEP